MTWNEGIHEHRHRTRRRIWRTLRKARPAAHQPLVRRHEGGFTRYWLDGGEVRSRGVAAGRAAAGGPPQERLTRRAVHQRHHTAAVAGRPGSCSPPGHPLPAPSPLPAPTARASSRWGPKTPRLVVPVVPGSAVAPALARSMTDCVPAGWRMQHWAASARATIRPTSASWRRWRQWYGRSGADPVRSRQCKPGSRLLSGCSDQ